MDKRNIIENEKRKPVLLNLGCDNKIYPKEQGWLNVDIEQKPGVNIVADCRNLKDLPDNFADEIHAYHIIEHFHINEVKDVLKNWLRVLKPGGKLCLEQPDIIKCCSNVLQEFTTKNEIIYHNLGMVGIFGDPGCTDNPYMFHKWGWHTGSLSKVLKQAGYVSFHAEEPKTHQKALRDFRLVGYKLLEDGKAPKPYPCFTERLEMEKRKTEPQTLKIRPQDCVAHQKLVDNVGENLELIQNWTVPCQPHKGKAYLISAGPSLEDNIEELKEELKERQPYDKVFCVKHSLPRLLKAGITPDFCVVLDPREIEGISTHGIKRKDLFESAPKEVVFLVASMTNTTVTKHLLKEGYTIVGWHAVCNGIEKYKSKIKQMVYGGTSSATRSIGLAYSLGFQNEVLIGYDSSIKGAPENPEDTLEDGRPKYLQVLIGKEEVEGTRLKRWDKAREPQAGDIGPIWTTPELAAQIQDMERILRDPKVGINFDVRNGGVVGIISNMLEINTNHCINFLELVKGMSNTQPTAGQSKDVMEEALNTIDTLSNLNNKDIKDQQDS